MLMLKFVFLSFGVLLLSLDWLLIIVFLLGRVLVYIIFNWSYDLGVINFLLVDNLRFLLIVLSFWITILMFIISLYLKFRNNNFGIFSIMCLVMMLFLIMSFRTSNLLMFYLMFEATLIPIFILIMGWGYQPERVKASYYLLFYTLTASLPILLAIFYLSDFVASLDYVMFLNSIQWGVLIFVVMVLAFLVKIPVYFFHLWLPKAHVEAPVAGSIVLAGVLLKLGGYGLIRVCILLGDSFTSYSSWLVGLSVFGGILASLVCVRQTDCKSLVAYSSVAHIALVLLGIFVISFLGFSGAIIIIVAHGLCSSGLFALVGMVYERTGTRSLLLLRGSLTMAPILALWWFLFRISNMAAPPTPNLAGEILIFISSLNWLGIVAFIVGLISFLGAVYNLFLFSCTQHGNEVVIVGGQSDGCMRENLVLFLHLFPLILVLPVLMNMYACRCSLRKT